VENYRGGDLRSDCFTSYTQVPGVLAVLDFKKAETLADSLEPQFQPVNILSESAIIEMCNEVLHAILVCFNKGN
jgi:hypothetical protein